MALDWNLVAAPVESQGRAICYSPDLDRWVAFGEVAMYSDDGINWLQGTATDYHAVTNYVAKNAIIWNVNLQLFIAVCHDNNFTNDTHILTSADGATWTTRTGDGVPLLNQVAYEPVTGFTVIVADNGGCLTSTDGINWTAAGNDLVGVDASADWQGICWFPFASLFVAVANVGSVRIATSPDGLAWTGRHGFEVAYQRTWAYVAAHPSTDLVFACCGSNGRTFMRSEDGITWETPYTIPIITPGFFGVEAYITFWSATLSAIVLLVDNDVDTEGQVLTNPTGASTDWVEDSLIPDTIVSSGSAWEWQALAENDGEGRFVAGQENPSDEPFATALSGAIEITGDLALTITDDSLILSPNEMAEPFALEIQLLEYYEIVGNLALEISLDPVTVWSADASGLYILVPGKTDDTIYAREHTEETQDVAIPDPTIGTAYIGG